MATLSGKKIADTFDSILHLTDEDGPLTGTVQVVEDGLGNDSALYLATDQVKILPPSGDTVEAVKVGLELKEQEKLELVILVVEVDLAMDQVRMQVELEEKVL